MKDSIPSLFVLDQDLEGAKDLACGIVGGTESFRVFVADKGEPVLVFLQDNPCDVVISGSRLADMTGLEFLTRLKLLQTGGIRIYLGADEESRDLDAAVRDGTIHYSLASPADVGELASLVRRSSALPVEPEVPAPQSIHPFPPSRTEDSPKPWASGNPIPASGEWFHEESGPGSAPGEIVPGTGAAGLFGEAPAEPVPGETDGRPRDARLPEKEPSAEERADFSPESLHGIEVTEALVHENRELRERVLALEEELLRLREESRAALAFSPAPSEPMEEEGEGLPAEDRARREVLEALDQENRELKAQMEAMEEELRRVRERLNAAPQPGEPPPSGAGPDALRQSVDPLEIYKKAEEWHTELLQARQLRFLLEVKLREQEQALSASHEECEGIRRSMEKIRSELQRDLAESQQRSRDLNRQLQAAEARCSQLERENGELAQKLSWIQDLCKNRV